MSDKLTDEELEEWKEIIQTFPKREREKWQTLVKSGRLISLVTTMDSLCTFLEKFGTFGMWINKVVKGIFAIVAVFLLFKFVVFGDVTVSEIWKLFIK